MNMHSRAGGKVPISSVLGEHKAPSPQSLAQEPLTEKNPPLKSSLSSVDSKPLRESTFEYDKRPHCPVVVVFFPRKIIKFRKVNEGYCVFCLLVRVALSNAICPAILA